MALYILLNLVFLYAAAPDADGRVKGYVLPATPRRAQASVRRVVRAALL